MTGHDRGFGVRLGRNAAGRTAHLPGLPGAGQVRGALRDRGCRGQSGRGRRACWTWRAAPVCSAGGWPSRGRRSPGSIWRRRCWPSPGSCPRGSRSWRRAPTRCRFPTTRSTSSPASRGCSSSPTGPPAVAEMRRVLRPGGRVVIACWCDDTQSAILLVEQALRRHVGEEAATMVHGVFAIDRESVLEELLIGAGFADVEVRREPIVARYVPGLGFAGRFIAANPGRRHVRRRAGGGAGGGGRRRRCGDPADARRRRRGVPDAVADRVRHRVALA